MASLCTMETMGDQACSYEQSDLFTNPGRACDPSTELAISICRECPLIVECARLALVGGSSHDWRATAPATGVIQAGVYCNGSAEAVAKLEEIAYGGGK